MCAQLSDDYFVNQIKKKDLNSVSPKYIMLKCMYELKKCALLN